MQLPDSYALAPDAQAILARLVRDVAEFEHLSQARVVCLLSQRVPTLHGHPCEAFISQPSVQGQFSPFFDYLVERFVASVVDGQAPDYLVMIDAALWPGLSPERQERLIFHELCHLQPKEDTTGRGIRLDSEGRPQLKVVPHDIERFNEEIRRYGPALTGIHDTCVAIADGLERERELLAAAKPKLRVAGGRRS